MWTPKRILLLAGAFGLFFFTYLVYSQFLGGIDSLPPLPPEYLPDPNYSEPLVESTPRPSNHLNQMLKLAFGEECPEVKDRPLKFEVRAKGIILAASDFQIADGKVCLRPISVAIFGKTPVPGQYPEINTVRAEVAYLTFDRPIVKAADISERHIVAGELEGKIQIVNNRRTPARSDDIFLDIPRGPLYFREGKGKIWSDKDGAPPCEGKPHLWTTDRITLEDRSSQPPITIKAAGMDLYLATAAPAKPIPGARKPRTETITGVDQVHLRSGVEMRLYTDSGLLSTSTVKAPVGNSKAAPAKPAADPVKNLEVGDDVPRGKSEVIITTQGPFHYDVIKDFAEFDIPPVDPLRPIRFPEQVLVSRRNQEFGPLDQLACEHLELQFRRKAAAGPGPRDDHNLDLEIDSAHATGKSVVLTSDAEMLEAHGNDFFYNALTKQTNLKGDPEMWALKEGNEIHARELQLVDQKGAQTATATGVGHIDLLDKATGKRPLHASWKESFSSRRDGPHELLTLIGDAVFQDDEHDQRLTGDKLQVWLQSGDRLPPLDQAPASNGGRRPHHVEATGRVGALSREMNVHDTDRLIVHFKDVALKPETTPADVPAGGAPKAVVPDKPMPGKGPAQPDPAAKPARPIDLSARMIEAYVQRDGPRNDLDVLRAEGVVRVRQEPAGPEDKGVDISGETLKLTHYADGNKLIVTGDLAELHLNKLYIRGPQVEIDQVKNVASVDGVGSMVMESDTDLLQGTKLKRTVPLTIYWNQHMYFSGRDAEFHGGIQAEQENARLACQVLRVSLDRTVSLKEGAKGEEPAKVQHLVCDQDVKLKETVEENGKVVKDQRMTCPVLAVDKTQEIVQGSGPGTLRIFKAGTTEVVKGAVPSVPVAPAPKTNGPAANEETKLTYVSYFGRMWANNKIHLATFHDGVKVLHLPTDDPNLKIDLDRMLDALPKGALFLKSEKLEVLSHEEKGKTYQEMKAERQVFVKGADFSGTAEVVTYNEAKTQIIFQGGPNGRAKLYKFKAQPGLPPDVIDAGKILYNITTGEHSTSETRGIQSGN